MSADILLTIVVTATIQSIFGVGVLLFGTPLLLLLGYDFVTALTILLPISVAINLFQISQHYKLIDLAFYKNILIFTVPFVVLFLFLVTQFQINISFVIGLFLVFVALKNYSPKINQMVDSLVRFEKSYFISMGVIHGLTNLGGSLLTAIVHGKNYGKDTARVTIAAAYATFAVFQIITLSATGQSSDISFLDIGAYLTLGVMIYVYIDAMLYSTLDNAKYRKIFAVFLLASGLLLMGKSVT